jgi:hypothetical protein
MVFLFKLLMLAKQQFGDIGEVGKSGDISKTFKQLLKIIE